MTLVCKMIDGDLEIKILGQRYENRNSHLRAIRHLLYDPVVISN